MHEQAHGERGVEAELERMFAHTPPGADAELFAARVQDKLNQRWNVRRFGIGAAGVIGGLIAVTQALGSGLAFELEQASASSVQGAEGLYRQALVEAEKLPQLLPFENTGMTAFWIASGLLVLFAAAASARLFDEV
jgi:hypothetical protein